MLKTLPCCINAIHWQSKDFPDGRRQPLCLDRKPIIWEDFCRKLHGNEINGTEWGHIPGALPGSANAI